MNASPSLQFEVKPGPALTTGQTKAPALVLNATISSPALKISHEAMAVFSDVSHAIPALVFVCLGCLVSIVTVPLSQIAGRGKLDGILEIRDDTGNMREVAIKLMGPQ